MEDTSDAANMTCHGTDNEKSDNATSQLSVWQRDNMAHLALQ